MFSLSLLRPRLFFLFPMLLLMLLLCAACDNSHPAIQESNPSQTVVMRPLDHENFIAKWQSLQAEYELELPLNIRNRTGEKGFYVLRADLPAEMQLLVYEKQGVVMRAELRARPLDRRQMFVMMNAWALTASLFAGRSPDELNGLLHQLGVQPNANVIALQHTDGGREVSLGSATCRASSAETGYFFECSGRILR